MKRLVVFLISSMMLVGCGNPTNQAMKLINQTVEKDQEVITGLREVEEREKMFLESFNQLLVKAEEDFTQVDEMKEETLKSLSEIKESLTRQAKDLALSEKEKNKMKETSETVDGDVSKLLNSFLAYKAMMTHYLESKLEVHESYEAFLTSVTSDIPFKELEKLLSVLNLQINLTNQAYEGYELALQDFSNQYQLMME